MDNKIWWASKTIMGIVALVIVQIATRFNLKVPDDAVAQITDALLQIAAAIAALWAIYGRSKASTTLTLTKPKDDQGGGTPPAAGIALLFATAFMLSACGTSLDKYVPPTPKTPQQAVFEAKGEYAVLLRGANIYNARPRCDAPNAPKLCSEQSVVEIVRKANGAVLTTLDAAEATVRDPKFGGSIADSSVVAAQNALAAFREILKQNGVQL